MTPPHFVFRSCMLNFLRCTCWLGAGHLGPGPAGSCPTQNSGRAGSSPACAGPGSQHAAIQHHSRVNGVGKPDEVVCRQEEGVGLLPLTGWTEAWACELPYLMHGLARFSYSPRLDCSKITAQNPSAECGTKQIGCQEARDADVPSRGVECTWVGHCSRLALMACGVAATTAAPHQQGQSRRSARSTGKSVQLSHWRRLSSAASACGPARRHEGCCRGHLRACRVRHRPGIGLMEGGLCEIVPAGQPSVVQV